MLGNFKIITSNHNTNQTSDLGAFMVKEGQESIVFSTLKELGIEEIIYLPTCNRVLYLFYSNLEMDKDYVTKFLRLINIDKFENSILSKLEVYEGFEAIGHVMEVAGSIDSLVVGEREIFRQFRAAYNHSLQLGFIKHNLKLLEGLVVKTAKKIYTHTRIGEKPLSIASLAMTSIIENIDITETNQICLIGAGETNTLLSKLLSPKNIGNFTVFNRSKNNGETLADKLNGKYYQLGEINNSIKNFDVIITATSSHEILIDLDFINTLNKVYGQKSRLFIDLSVPPNIDSKINQVDQIKLITIDDLKQLADLNLKARRNEIIIAKEIVNKSKTEFGTKFQERKIELALAEVPTEIKAVKEKALNNVFAKRLSQHPEEVQNLVKDVMNYMEKKCVSIPMKAAKKGLL